MNAAIPFKDAASDRSITLSCESGLPKIVIGKAFVVNTDLPIPPRESETLVDAEAEKQKFLTAFANMKTAYTESLEKAAHVTFELREALEGVIMQEMSIALSKATRQVIDGKPRGTDSIYTLTLKGIEQGLTAERAVYEACNLVEETMLAKIKASNIPTPPEKVREEFAGIRNDYLQTLRTGSPHSISSIPEGGVLVTDSMNVGTLITYRDEDRRWFMSGLVDAVGSQKTHAAIVARGSGLLRMCLNEKQDLTRIKDGDTLILDGTQGRIIVNPTPEQLEEYGLFSSQQRDVYLELMARLEKAKTKPLITRNGKLMHVSANTMTSDDIQPALMSGAESIGLLRTELAALTNGGTLTEEKWQAFFNHVMNEDLLAYAKFYPEMPPDKRPSPVIRTTDFSGDKHVEVSEPQEPRQIGALLKALKGNEQYRASLLIPMVTDPKAFNEMGLFMRQQAKEIGVAPVPYGAMLETPAIIADMDQLQADFFSVGTNDLCALTFGTDRYKERADESHPRFLGLLNEAQKKAENAGKDICVCGDMASNLLYQPLLIGLGYDHISIGPDSIPGTYEYIARLHSEECEVLAFAVAACTDTDKREELLWKFAEDHGLRRNGTLDVNWKPPEGPPPSIANHM